MVLQLRRQKAKEEFAIVLDFLKHGYSDDTRPFHMKEPIVQAIGKDHFVLLELVPNKDISLSPQEEIYVGEGKRDKINYIKGILQASKLTQTAKSTLKLVVESLVSKNEERFVEFFNKAGPISLRSHQLELLPGIGKQHCKMLLSARENQPFESFEDISKRVTAVSNPKGTIINRILEELENKDRYKLFVRA